MNEISERLKKCFALALPDLPQKEIPRASMTSVAAWDSLATVNLLSLIEEEFGIQVPDAELESFQSFERIQSYLAKLPSNATG